MATLFSLNDIMAVILNVYVTAEIRLRHAMHIYVQNISAKFRPDMI